MSEIIEANFTGLRTHFEDFDRLTGGLHESELIVIAGRPSMGKTAFVMNIAENVAVFDKKVVGVFSLQMSRESLLLRLLSSQARVDSHKLRMGFLRRRDVTRVVAGLGRLLETPPLFIDDTHELSLPAMRAKCHQFRRSHGRLDLVVIDCVQLMSLTPPSEPPFRGNRRQELSAISRGLKSLSKELGCPVIAVCSLKRATGVWLNAHPTLSDLNDYGSIEAEADVVAFIHRQEVYMPDDPDLNGKAELILAKQRNGPTGIIPLVFLKSCTRFENCADVSPPEHN